MEAGQGTDHSLLYNTLKQDVYGALADKRLRGPINLYIKSLVLAGAWFISYFNFLYSGQLDNPFYCFFAMFFLFLTSSALTLNIIHEGSHRSLSTSKFINHLAQMMVSCVYGISTINWYEKHVKRHHVYTNIYAKDFDINSKGLFRYSSLDPWRAWHKWQAYYAVPLYALYILKWIYIGDFKDLFYNIYELSIPKRMLLFLEIIATRMAHVVLFIIIPLHYFSSLQFFIGYYVTFLLLSGLITSIIFQLAHVVPDLFFLLRAENFTANQLLHQLSSTSDFSSQNKILTYFTGGLNMQVIHHLFPHVSHTHYSTIQPIVKSFCKKNNLPYHEYSTCGSAIKAHFSYLNRLGKKPQIH